MRLILTDTTECTLSCKGCYYGWRVYPGRDPLDIYDVMEANDHPLAIGINMEQEDTLARTAVTSGRDTIITIPYGYTLAPEIAASATRVVTSMRCLPHGEPPVMMAYLDTFEYLDAVEGNVYLLMEKGAPDNGWRMTDERIDSYLSRFNALQEHATVTMDECVHGIVYGDMRHGNCGGKWMEIDQYGGVRACPYTACEDLVLADNKLRCMVTYTRPMCRPETNFDRIWNTLQRWYESGDRRVQQRHERNAIRIEPSSTPFTRETIPW